MTRVTLKDVAMQAAVAVPTASQVLSGRGNTRVSPATRQRILDAVQALDYRPNRLSQALRTSRSRIVGLLSGAIPTTHTVAARLSSLEYELTQAGYAVVLNSHRNSANEENAIQQLEDFSCDGVVYLPGMFPPSKRLQSLVQRGVPVIVMGYDVGLPCPLVGVDYHAGGRKVVEHLYQRGARRFAFVYVSAKTSMADPLALRLRGYRQAYEQHVGRWAEAVRLSGPPCDDLSALGYELGGKLLTLRTPVDAVVCSNDLIAVGLAARLRRAGIDTVEAGIRIAGFDDLPMVRYVDPPLLTVAQPNVEVGRVASRMILEAMGAQRRPTEASRVLLTPRLVDYTDLFPLDEEAQA